MMPAAPLPPPGQDPRKAPPVQMDAPQVSATPPQEAAASLPLPAAPPVAPRLKPAPPARRSRQELTKRERLVTAADEAAFAAMEVELGGRPSLVSVLVAADLNGDERGILGLLADPQNDGISLAKLCLGAAGGGMSLTRLMKVFQSAALAKGQVKAIARIAAKLPDVAAGVMEDAIAGERVCDTCNGFQFLPKPTEADPLAVEKCSVCLGKGTIQFHPDSDIREMALRIGGLLEKGGGNKILIAQKFGGGGVADSGSFDTLMQGLDSELYGAGRARQREAKRPPADAPQDPVDGEVVE